jgi:hypothetical protein
MILLHEYARIKQEVYRIMNMKCWLHTRQAQTQKIWCLKFVAIKHTIVEINNIRHYLRCKPSPTEALYTHMQHYCLICILYTYKTKPNMCLKRVRLWTFSSVKKPHIDHYDCNCLFFPPLAPTLEHTADFSVSWSFYRRQDSLDGPLPKHRTQTQNKRIHTTNIHALCGIRTHAPGFRASEDSTCLRPLGYRDRRNSHTSDLLTKQTEYKQ